MLRALIHHWRIHVAVIAGAAVASAVLTGALLVGDSVRGSLREMTLQRLGGSFRDSDGRSTFRATMRPSCFWRALNTVPMAPAPMRSRIS